MGCEQSDQMEYEISPEQVKGKLDAGEEFTLVDVREPWEFETANGRSQADPNG